ncbi:hypothetical protein KAT51_01005 [bacterium]|nr:hypothetical protein [bacterium]
MATQGEIRVFNPNKEISREITLEVLIRHRNSMKQARTGELTDVAVEQLDDNNRMLNRVRALNLIIAAQREMISISRPIIFFRSDKEFKKHTRKTKNKKGENEDKVEVFEDFKCDYNTLIKEHLELLKACERDIIEAERSKTLDDDFIREEEEYDGKRIRLTENFYEMLEELEGSYEKIYLMMLTNKIVSAGIEDDEELDYKQKEEEAIKRAVEA